MGYFSEQLKQYLAIATPEQLEQDRIILEEYSTVGPLVEDYFEELKGIPEMLISPIISSEYSLSFNF